MHYSARAGAVLFRGLSRRLMLLITVPLVIGTLLPIAPITPLARAAEPLFEFPIPIPGSGAKSTTGAVLGDLNGDGVLDMVLAHYLAPSQVYLGDGQTGFHTPTDLPGSGRRTQSVALGDINNDDALDVVLGNESQLSQVYLGDGRGSFRGLADLPGSGRGTASVALGDANGDRTLDLVLGNFVGASQVYLGDGQGGFRAPTDLADSGKRTTSVALGDVNGDQALDVVLGNFDKPSQVYLGTGQGSFRPPTDLANSGKSTPGIALGDVNGDGALDLVLSNAALPGQVYLGTGQGSFRPPIDLPLSSANTTSVALGDVNGDSALDLVLGNEGQQPSQVFLGTGEGGFQTPFGLPGGGMFTKSVALGDVNGDSALDLIAGTSNAPSQVFLGTGQGGFRPPSDLFSDERNTQSVMLGDLDGDRALDLVLGNFDGPGQVYLNDGHGSFRAPADLAGSHEGTQSLALGDLNGDGALDLVLGNVLAASQVYVGDGRGSFRPPTDLPSSSRGAISVVLGDVNSDGALDLLLSHPWLTQVYLGTGHGDFRPPSDLPGGGRNIVSAALGDLNQDTALDLVVGNSNKPSQVYLGDGRGSFRTPTDLPNSGRDTRSVVLGDLNADGYLDLVIGNSNEPSQVYIGDGRGSVHPPSDLAGSGKSSRSVALSDVNGDGLLDLAMGNAGLLSQVYLGNGQGSFRTPSDLPGDASNSTSIAMGDVNGDGGIDLILVGAHPARVFLNGLPGTARPFYNPAISVIRPGVTANANFFSTPEILSDQSIPVRYTLFDPQGATVRSVQAFYSLDGGGQWLPANTAAGTNRIDARNLPTICSGQACTYSYPWDTFRSNFFGQSDNVVFRIVAYPGVRAVRSNVARSYQHPLVSASTFPFRVRGTQVRVVGSGVPTLKPTAAQPPAIPAPVAESHRLFLPLAATAPVAVVGAEVYRIHAEQIGTPLTAGSGQPYRTNSQGYLNGYGAIALGDQLVALQPISATAAYTVYLTSAAPTTSGLAATSVTMPGVQTLTVSPDHPLVLLNLTVSLEWDSSSDPQFRAQLDTDLQRTSELLYGWSNGQLALGQVTIYQNKAQWDTANIRIAASNRIRPNAAKGGIVGHLTTETVVVPGANGQPTSKAVTYAPGEVRIGATWNRYGDTSGTIGEDWPRALAHEVGHYALYLDDNYLGVNAAGEFTTVDTCIGAMSDPYRDDYGLFHAHKDWLPSCRDTLSERSTGRADWDTIAKFYPWLHPPADPIANMNRGPKHLPLAVTHVRWSAPSASTTLLDAPIFYIKDAIIGARVIPNASARAFIFRGSRIIDLGRPTLDQVLARGAQVGDRLCMYELATVDANGRPLPSRLGCQATITSTNRQLLVVSRAGWQPDIRVTPVTSRTLQVDVPMNSVGQPAPTLLQARLFANDKAYDIVLARAASGEAYSGKFTVPNADTPVLEGYVQVWVNEAGQRREMVTDYALGGGPVRIGGSGGGGVGRDTRTAPAVSADGQVILYSENLTFGANQFYALQAATSAATAPKWTTVIGHAYRLTTTANVPDLRSASISLSYSGGEVAQREEPYIHVYYSADGSSWQILTTTLDTYYNVAAAPVQGPGLYALMSSIEIPLSFGQNGANLFAYPVNEARPVRDALGSIEGFYTSLSTYDATDPAGPWLTFDAAKPDALNTLKTLKPYHGYWITVTQDIVLRLRGDNPNLGVTVATSVAASTGAIEYYGRVDVGADSAQPSGTRVLARVNDVICGRGSTFLVNGVVMYDIWVLADGEGAVGCGASGRRITFQVGRHIMTTSATWANDRQQELVLRP